MLPDAACSRSDRVSDLLAEGVGNWVQASRRPAACRLLGLSTVIRFGIVLLSIALGSRPASGQAATEIPAPSLVVQPADGPSLPVIQRGGVLLYPYGHGRPELQCAPLRTCKIILLENENLLARASGDSQRWEIAPMTGPGGASIVVAKPLACDISTDLTLVTDQRIYEMLLWAPPCADGEFEHNPRVPYTPLTGFYHPNASTVTSLPDRAGTSRDREEDQGQPASSVLNGDLSKLYFGYSWQRDKRFPWLPQQVFDDGARMHIRIPPEAARYDLPVLFELTPGGAMHIVNYVVAGAQQDVYIVDRLLDRALFVIGHGRHDEPLRLIISRKDELQR